MKKKILIMSSKKYDALTHLRSMSSSRTEDLFSMRGKICVVTGGSRGIGLMIAKAYVENGAKVYVSSRKKDACDLVARELTNLGPGTAVSMPADISSDAGCKELAERIAKQERRIDVLVNNAGVTWGSPFETFPEMAWERVMTLNVASVFNMTRACVPLLREASKGNLNPSHVINITSVAGHPDSAPEDDIAPSYVINVHSYVINVHSSFHHIKSLQQHTHTHTGTVLPRQRATN